MGTFPNNDHGPLGSGQILLVARARLGGLALRFAPWVLFALFLVWGWRVNSFSSSLPAYGDVVEVTWIASWYDAALRGGHTAAVYPMIFYPAGWHVATYAGGPAILLALLPLNWLGGVAFAYNVLTLGTFALGFAGFLALARRFLSTLPATVAALLYTFWGFHWFRIIGHMNILIAAAILPWLVWSLERSSDAGRRPYRWLITVGVLWALAATSSWYFLLMGAILIGAWVIGRWLGHTTDRRHAIRSLAVPAVTALALATPFLTSFALESAAANAASYDIVHVSAWDASLNSFPVPNVDHPVLGTVARTLYRGPTNEPGRANFGLLASAMALLAIKSVWKDRRWLPAALLVFVGLLLSLGLTLKWNGQPLRWEAVRGVDEAIWRVGYQLKPGFFGAAVPPAPFDTSIPMPGLLLSALVPLWEQARVFARYAMLASIGVYLLTALSLAQVRQAWLRWLLAGLLLFEVLPPPSGSVPYPGAAHPVFAWLREQSLGSQGIVDLDSWQPDLLYLPNRGETLMATAIHGKPTVAGASSILPAHAAFLDRWLGLHPHAFLDADLAPILRGFSVRYILLHISGGYAEDALQEARQSNGLKEVRCFEPSPDPGPWPYPICVFEVQPWPSESFDVIFREGWSGMESWGRWAEGTESRAAWVAPLPVPYRLTVEAFPVCVPGRTQSLTIEVNGETEAMHQWTGCDSWSAEITIPSRLVHAGFNEIILRPAFAARPVDFSGGQNPDPRALSVGVNRLSVSP